MLRKMPRSGISQLKSSIANERVPNEAFKNAEPFSTHAPYNLRNSNQSDDVQSDIHRRPRRSWSNGSLPAVHGHEWAGFAPVDCVKLESIGPLLLILRRPVEQPNTTASKCSSAISPPEIANSGTFGGIHNHSNRTRYRTYLPRNSCKRRGTSSPRCVFGDSVESRRNPHLRIPSPDRNRKEWRSGS